MALLNDKQHSLALLRISQSLSKLRVSLPQARDLEVTNGEDEAKFPLSLELVCP